MIGILRPSRQLVRFFSGGLEFIEFVGLLAIAFATTVAMGEEIMAMYASRRVHLADLLMMFLFLEVLAMIGQYFKMGQLPIQFPLYIAIVALSRYLILDIKEMTETKVLTLTFAILLLAVAVLVIRFGHVRFAYPEDAKEQEKPSDDHGHAHNV